MMNKEQKKNYISEMETQFQNNEAVMVTHYQGLTMSQLDELRGQMREHGIKFTITKNRITKIALEKTKCKELSNLFTGATAVAFSDDAIISARILSKFAKTIDLDIAEFNKCLDESKYKNKINVSVIPLIFVSFSLFYKPSFGQSSPRSCRCHDPLVIIFNA